MDGSERALEKEEWRKTREDNKGADGGLTSWAASEDQLTDFIIDEDEQGVRECTEPPVGPGKHTQAGNEKLIQHPRCKRRTCGQWSHRIERTQQWGLRGRFH